MNVSWSIVGSLLVAVLIVYIAYLFLNSIKIDNSSIPFVRSQNYPIVGNLFAFPFDQIHFLIKNKERYGSCFTIKLFNRRITFVLDPRDWSAVSRNAHLEMPVADMGHAFGTYMSPAAYKDIEPDIHRFYVKHLLGQSGLDILTDRFVQCVRETMMRDQAKNSDNKKSGGWRSCGLLELSHMMIFEASARTLFGDIDSLKMENDFRIFDANIHLFFSFFPDFIYKLFFRRALEARTRLNHFWFQHVHADNESRVIQARTERIFKNSEASLNFGGLQTGILWGSVGNTIPATFWTLLCILRDPDAIKAIKAEIDVHLPTYLLDDQINTVNGWSSETLAQCVQLESAINETLRLMHAGMIDTIHLFPSDE